MRRPCLLLPLLLAASARPAAACSVPVFRYALERWEPAPCEAFVYHRAAPDAAARRLPADLSDRDRPANLTLQTVDLPGLPLGTLCPRVGEPPWLVVRT